MIGFDGDCLERVFIIGKIFDKVVFLQKIEGGDRQSCVDIEEKVFQGERKVSVDILVGNLYSFCDNYVYGNSINYYLIIFLLVFFEYQVLIEYRFKIVFFFELNKIKFIFLKQFFFWEWKIYMF